METITVPYPCPLKFVPVYTLLLKCCYNFLDELSNYYICKVIVRTQITSSFLLELLASFATSATSIPPQKLTDAQPTNHVSMSASSVEVRSSPAEELPYPNQSIVL